MRHIMTYILSDRKVSERKLFNDYEDFITVDGILRYLTQDKVFNKTL